MPISYLARFTCRVCEAVEVVPIDKVYSKLFAYVQVMPTPPLGWMGDCCSKCKDRVSRENREYLDKLFAEKQKKP